VESRENQGSNVFCSSNGTKVVRCRSDNMLCSSEGAGVMRFWSEDGLVVELPFGYQIEIIVSIPLHP